MSDTTNPCSRVLVHLTENESRWLLAFLRQAAMEKITLKDKMLAQSLAILLQDEMEESGLEVDNE